MSSRIDVEGFELAVLRGATNLLESGRIKSLVIEVDGHEGRYCETPGALQEIMKIHDYQLDENLSVSGREGGNCAVYVHNSGRKTGAQRRE